MQLIECKHYSLYIAMGQEIAKAKEPLVLLNVWHVHCTELHLAGRLRPGHLAAYGEVQAILPSEQIIGNNALAVLV